MSKAWWRPRLTGDPGSDRRAISIQSGCLVLFLAIGAAIVRSVGWRASDLIVPMVLAELAVSAALAFNYAGKGTWAARVVTFGTLFASAFIVGQAHDGFRSIIMLAFPGVLLVAVMLFSGVDYLVLALATLLTVTVLGVAEIHGWVPTVPIARTPVDYTTIVIVDLLIATGAVFGGLFARDARLNVATLRATVDQLAHSEAALRDSEQRFHSLSDASFEGIMIHDRGVILDANLAFARLFGYERPEEFIGKNGPGLMLTPESRARILERIERGEVGVLELTGIRRDGSSFLAETESRPMKHLGRDARLVACRDITERKRAEQEKARMEAHLHQSLKMESIGRLAGGIAHDFNNLLTVINGYSHMLAQQCDGSTRHYAEHINRAGELAAGLTRQLLAFSRNEAARSEPVWLNDIVAKSKGLLERLVGEHIEMKTSLQACPDTVLADPSQIQQCLMNLVVNARDAMPSGGRLTIESRNVEVNRDEIGMAGSGAPGPHVLLTVRDTGIGMDEGTIRHIFEPFFTMKEQGRGVGLGLYTVYGIVRRWQGFLKVESEMEKGSHFSIYLPLHAAHDRLQDPTVEAGAPPAALKSVLVVDDQDIVREFIVESLRRRGYTVLEARNGAEALQVIGRNAAGIHLMLTDVRMPGMGGMELAKRAHAACPSMKVLLMTGYADDSPSSIDAPDSAEVIMKPFAPEVLEARIRELLGPGGERQ